MKTILSLTVLAFVFVAASSPCFAVEPEPVATKSAKVGVKKTPRYVTTQEIKEIAPCTATLSKRISEYSCAFTTADGKAFVLGDPRGEQWVWHFVGALNEGQSYKLPDEFLNYVAAPHYVTDKEITRMASRTGTLASSSPCSAYFRTADGKWFGIGDPGSGAEVSQYLATLKRGNAYRFPDSFLAYKAAPKYATAKEITAMVPRTAKLTTAFTTFCYFTTADGKGFIVGSPNKESEAVVRHFLDKLEEEKTYKFPDVFLEFLKKK
jgi:hypothetical protein